METKRYVSVICEYNPFHFGHRFQMESLKRQFDGVVCIMSGDIVQRGSVAIADKYLRAEAALNNGADLVVELPIPWCCSSARDFARAGVHIADMIGVGTLAFGAEDDIECLLKIHALTESDSFQDRVKALVSEHKNLSYPQAITMLVEETLGKETSDAVKKPNNILSLEYLSALKGKGIEPFVVKRNKDFMSSSEIRAFYDAGKMLELLPEESKSIFGRESGVSFPRDAKKLDSFFIGRLRQINASGNYPSDIYSTPDDMMKKIVNTSVKCADIDALVAQCTDKGYTSARVRRSINAIVFSITNHMMRSMPTYTSVLASNGVGREILRNAKKKGGIDIITKPVRALNKSEETKNAFLFSKSVEDIISLASPIPKPADEGRNPIIRE